MGSFGFLCVLLGSCAFLWVFVGSRGFLWVLLGSFGFFWVLLGSRGFFRFFPYQNLPEPIRTHKNLSSPSEPILPTRPHFPPPPPPPQKKPLPLPHHKYLSTTLAHLAYIRYFCYSINISHHGFPSRPAQSQLHLLAMLSEGVSHLRYDLPLLRAILG